MNPANQQPGEAAASPGYWRDKTPCWVMLGCPVAVRARCDAFRHPQMPCWEQRATLCEELLRVPKECHRCVVYKAYRYQDFPDEFDYPE